MTKHYLLNINALPNDKTGHLFSHELLKSVLLLRKVIFGVSIEFLPIGIAAEIIGYTLIIGLGGCTFRCDLHTADGVHICWLFHDITPLLLGITIESNKYYGLIWQILVDGCTCK